MSKARKKTQRKVTMLIVELLVLILLAVILFVVIKLTKIEKNSLDDVTINEGISEESQDIMSNCRTVALFGLDNRSSGNLSSGRSDVIMLACIDDDAKEIRLVSVYRDSYLDTGGGTYQKCNNAYNDGPEAAVAMLNANLDLAIADYVAVDFTAVVECIDLLGGVELTITDDEASLMIGYMREINEITGRSSECPPCGGTYVLDGVQACAFSRIRFGGGEDYRRTERQREVLSAMFQKAKQSNILTINSLINQALQYVQTSLTNTDLLSLSTKLLRYDLGETSGFPFEKASHTYDSVGDVVIPCDLATNVTQLHVFLYGDENYTPSPTVQSNSETIISKTGFRAGDGY